MSKYRTGISSIRARGNSYPTCPWCGLSNYVFGHHMVDGQSVLGYYWDGLHQAINAGTKAHLWTRKGRIFGGPRKSKRWNRDVAPNPVRVNEKHWKIVRIRPRLLVACANTFHEEGNPNDVPK